MKRWNFNVTFPLFDWIHGTNWSEEREERRSRERLAVSSRDTEVTRVGAPRVGPEG